MNEEHLLREIVVNKYLRQITISKKQRAKHFKLTYTSTGVIEPNLPNKYNNKLKYDYNEEGILIDIRTKEKIVANAKQSGTPKLHTLSGNFIVSAGNGSQFIRTKVSDSLHAMYKAVLENVEPIKIEDFPLIITWEVHCSPAEWNWDLSNLFLYNKYFEDSLVVNGIIPDDSVLYISGSAAPLFFPIEDDEERKFVFRIYKDCRPEIRENPLWNNIRDNSQQSPDMDF